MILNVQAIGLSRCNGSDCANGLDDDDALVDCNDSDCASDRTKRSFCGDGQDNDNDGLTDCQDPDCATNPQCQGQNSEQICDDGQDNDNDGNADCGLRLCQRSRM